MTGALATVLAEARRWRGDLAARFTCDDDPEAFTLRELIEANLDWLPDVTELEALRAAAVGDEVQLGGGAVAVSTLRRVA